MFGFSTIEAQSDYKYGISIGTDYDVPVGNLAYSFKPAINYNLNLLEHYGNFTASASFGYHVYKPKMDTFYYQVTNADYGTIVYQNFSVISFYLGGTYDYPVSDNFKIYGGINLGVYNTHLVAADNAFVGGFEEDLHEEELYLATRVGFIFMVSDNAGIGVEGKYNFFAPTGDTDFDSRVGTLYNSWSVGLRLLYNF